MSEEVKRLKIKDGTLRRLYFTSGNQCAFPGCDQILVDPDGDFIAQVCHIEAANPGGERFNSNMTNEERRSFENLIILCHKDHIKTNNVDKYSVKTLQKMKKDHEDKYKDIIFNMRKSTVKDVTKNQKVKYPKSIRSLNTVMNWDYTASELKEYIKLTKNGLGTLKKLTIDQRNIFFTMLEKSENGLILLGEVQSALDLSNDMIRNKIDILVKYGLISEPELTEAHYSHTSDVLEVGGWDMWLDIKEFCSNTNNSLEEMIVNMDFRKLD